MELYFLLAIILSAILLFVVTHFRPLTDGEIKDLARKKREGVINQYFIFDKRSYFVDPAIKNKMNPNGRFYDIEKPLYNFPAYAAGMLKYKKHEWIIVAFEKEKKIFKIWLNKGFDRTQVGLFLNKEAVANMAKEFDCNSVLIFHNHPNINPSYYSCHRPSEKDLTSAKEYGQLFNSEGLNLIEFICERGICYRYFMSTSVKFIPEQIFINDILPLNGISKFKNLSLHCERLF